MSRPSSPTRFLRPTVLVMPAHARVTCVSRSAGSTSLATAALAAIDWRSTPSRGRPAISLAGQPPPITNVPYCVWRSDSGRVPAVLDELLQDRRPAVGRHHHDRVHHQRQVSADQAPDVAGLGAGGHHDASGHDRAAIGADLEFSPRARRDTFHPRIQLQSGAELLGAAHEGGCHQQGVREALGRTVAGAEQLLRQRRLVREHLARW